jgi:hypothetical protein
MQTYIEKYRNYCLEHSIKSPDKKVIQKFTETYLAPNEIEDFLFDILKESKNINKIFTDDKIATSFENAFDFIFALPPYILERCEDSIENFYQIASSKDDTFLISRIEAISSETGFGLREEFIKGLIEECSDNAGIRKVKLLILLVNVQKNKQNEDFVYWNNINKIMVDEPYLIIPLLLKYYQTDIDLALNIMAYYDHHTHGIDSNIDDKFGNFFDSLIIFILEKKVNESRDIAFGLEAV